MPAISENSSSGNALLAAPISEPCEELDVTTRIESILADEKLGWHMSFDHHQPGLFKAVNCRISALAKEQNVNSQELDKLLSYLRSFSYFGDVERLTSEDWQSLDGAVKQLAQMPAIYQSSKSAQRLIEHYLVTLYRFYSHEQLADNLAIHIPVLAKILKKSEPQPLNYSNDLQAQYTQLELYRTLGFLAYEARSNEKVKSALIAAVELDSDTGVFLHQQMLSHLMQLTGDDWQLHHSLWLLANFYQLVDEKQQQLLDQQVQEHLFDEQYKDSFNAKVNFSQIYLANSFRVLDNCQQEFNDRCQIPTLEQALPINHVCSDSLFIRATNLTQQQLTTACQRLIKQEAFFHQSIKTSHQPVANDFNDSLRVVIFDNYSDYNRYGQLIFNINTNNGGMYIEGTPSDADNQATFYSFQAFWQKPEFNVWNLNHEYVHYLDGRFTKYGGFGHFPSQVVWWTEGLAEYIAKAKENSRALKLVNDTKPQDWPNLTTIFSTVYADGSDRVYRWSYLAHLFLFEKYPSYMPRLAKLLKIDFFNGYQALLTEIATEHQQEFALWLSSYSERPQPEKQSTDEARQVTKMNRYWYRSYLLTEHLPLTSRHNHIMNVN